MTQRRFLQLDVFADRPGAGNPLAVVIDAEGLDTAAMQAFANWTNLSETIFLLPPGEGADYRVRIFTPRQELPFAGHPSVGAAWAAIESGLVPIHATSLVQDCAAGRLPVDVTTERAIRVRAPRARRVVSPADAPARLAAALPDVARGALPAALWTNGPGWWVVELADEPAVRGLAPDLAAITALTADAAVGLAVFAKADAGGDYDVVVRAFCPADGIPEDPVTGSANAAIGAALAEAGRVAHGGRYVASQGREVGRDGCVEVQVDTDGEVWIGGRVQAVVRGTVTW
ncbi:PhzF family phenazine biosynthesis protein [Lysobacter sp. TY2-98]|uniref:PhzF family phenazine biosynthesis protein n=1 Tax=Lysobacter sp. TY2-98 TaxID=2290922 RepID=UPI000E20A2C3|nr:PhzF family phenazine biosynthesis protein [Lysobacter sp. TY2-98]AXK71439.1 PhzF family phenazine biosynthesis protein [Lysobacter sp. TY2-98]